MTKIISYKGFDSQFKCRGFQYEVGKTYEHDGRVQACESGFHACESPLDVFQYYPPGTSRYAVVEQSGEIAKHDADSKIASASITVTAEVSLHEMIEGAVKWVIERAKPSKTNTNSGVQGAASNSGVQGAASNSGDCGAASNSGFRGAASNSGVRGAASNSGFRGAASNSGDCGAASNSGDCGAASNSGEHGVAMDASGSGRVKGTKGSALFLVHRNNDGEITHTYSGIVGKTRGLKPDVWYRLNAKGKVEAAE